MAKMAIMALLSRTMLAGTPKMTLVQITEIIGITVAHRPAAGVTTTRMPMVTIATNGPITVVTPVVQSLGPIIRLKATVKSMVGAMAELSPHVPTTDQVTPTGTIKMVIAAVGVSQTQMRGHRPTTRAMVRVGNGRTATAMAGVRRTTEHIRMATKKPL